MLQTLREKTSGWIAAAIIGALIIPFAFFGVNNYFEAQVESWTAKVGEVEISQGDFRRRFDEYRQQVQQMMGDAYDPRSLEQPTVKKRLLDRMIDEEILRQIGSQLGVVVAPSLLQSEIAGIEAFKKDGKFDIDQYKVLLATQNMTPRSFEDRMRRDLEVQSLPAAIGSSALVSGADVDRHIELRDQTRDIRYVELPVPVIADSPEPSADELKKFYDDHSDRYRSEETVSIEYVIADSSKLEIAVSADEETLRRRYEEQSNRFVEPEQRLASHILLKVATDADAKTQQVVAARAQELVDLARASGADFAQLAKAHSEDPGSRNSGGDLGWLEKGITDPAFESALFALEAGKVSAPVKGADGWHVIWLRELRPGKTKPFEEVRPDLEREFLETERERAHSDLAGKLVDIIYRDPTTLKSAAEELKLEVQRTEAFGRAGGADAISANPQVAKAAFSDAVLIDGNVSDPIELDAGRTVVIKLLTHSPSAPIELAEVRAQIIGEWQSERRVAVARDASAAAYQRLVDGLALDVLASELKVEMKTANGIGRGAVNADGAVVRKAFEMVIAKNASAASTVVELGGERFAVLELLAVHDGNAAAIDGEARKGVRSQLAQARGQAETEAFIAALRAQTEVRIAEDRM